MFFNQHKLVDNIIEYRRHVIPRGIFGIKRPCHIQAIQPHLVGVDLFVPESAAEGAHLMLKLVDQNTDRSSIPRVAGRLKQWEQQPARVNLIQVIFIYLVAAYLSLRVDKMVNPFLVNTLKT
jgi:hypothetical protein